MRSRPPLTDDQRARVAAAAVRQVRATLERQRDGSGQPDDLAPE